MSQMKIRQACEEDFELSFSLQEAAGGDMLKMYLGAGDLSVAKRCVKSFWTGSRNAFHFSNVFIAEKDGRPLGGIFMYASNDKQASRLPVWGILKNGGLRYLWYYLCRPRLAYTLIHFKESYGDSLYISTLATKPEARGQGIASALLDFATEQAKERKIQKLSLLVEPSRENAHRLYLKQGFVDKKRLSKPKDFIRMVKTI